MAFAYRMHSGRIAARAPFTSGRQSTRLVTRVASQEAPAAATDASSPSSYQRRLTTEEWRQLYEKDGTVDLFLNDDFNAGAKLIDGQIVYPEFGVGTGEGKSTGDCPTHRVKIYNHYADQVVEVDVPEDRYILWEAEDQGLELPVSCRMGCCTACAVRVKEGKVYQPEALGVSEELKRKGYALMCVAFPDSDCVLETVPEDEVYDLQFGRAFAQRALNKDSPSVERDDFALEIAQMDE